LRRWKMPGVLLNSHERTRRSREPRRTRQGGYGRTRTSLWSRIAAGSRAHGLCWCIAAGSRARVLCACVAAGSRARALRLTGATGTCRTYDRKAKSRSRSQSHQVIAATPRARSRQHQRRTKMARPGCQDQEVKRTTTRREGTIANPRSRGRGHDAKTTTETLKPRV
jgi:hypothetical protein